MLDGLSSVHAKGLVHRDISLANIMLTADRATPKIIGFDLAHGDAAVDDSELSSLMLTTVHEDGSAAGTHEFMSPEAWRGDIGKPTSHFSISKLVCLLTKHMYVQP